MKPEQLEVIRPASRTATRTFADPDQLAAALRSGDGKCKVLGRGVFHAESTVVELGRLTLQCGRESLARVAYHAMRPDKVGVLGWPRGGLLPVVRGTQMRPGDLMCLGRGTESYHRTAGSVDYGALILDADELERVAIELSGRELQVESALTLRPREPVFARLLSLIDDAHRVARADPQVFASDEACRALEQSLLHALVACLSDGEPRREPPTFTRRVQIMRRFEVVVEANVDRPLHVPELCALVGVPERTLRKCCQQHLGMGPHQYLLRRRIHLVRRALLHGGPGVATVTSIATNHGFWELGRFAVRYRSMFGEMPSATLRRSG